MTKHLTDTLQQRHLEYMSTHAVSGRAETAPALSSIESDHDRYFLGTIQEESLVSALMKRRAGVRRRKNVFFSPLVCVYYLPYSEVYSRHPREFVFDALGRYVPTSTVVPSFVARDSRVGEATVHKGHQPDSLLPPCGVRSQEEECKYRSGRLGMSRQAQSLETDRCIGGQAPLRRKQSVGSGLKPPERRRAHLASR
jgi:hypothetical protein